MEIVDPKCPKCGEEKFAWKPVPDVLGLKSLIGTIKVAEEEIESSTDLTVINTLKDDVERRKKLLENKLKRRTKQEGDALIIFCINCGEIIGTAGG
ncbi:MAG: hypothetical protein GPJ52_00075 [Candidatus Heimdallarchaeota archaeon]|nr:hypothetical protein [Candidatus Heimdallarchaeota archaeon]